MAEHPTFFVHTIIWVIKRVNNQPVRIVIKVVEATLSDNGILRIGVPVGYL